MGASEAGQWFRDERRKLESRLDEVLGVVHDPRVREVICSRPNSVARRVLQQMIELVAPYAGIPTSDPRLTEDQHLVERDVPDEYDE